jgi:hypothetical protein
MLHRFAAAAVLALAFVLPGCKEYKDQPTSAIEGSRFVKVDEAHFISTSEPSVTLAGTTTTYLIVKITFTNDTNADLAPAPEQFFYTQTDGTRLHASDQGSSVFIGVSNYKGIVKKGEKQDYTIGFRLSGQTQGGYIYYDAGS